MQKTADDTFLHNGKKFKNSKKETILGVIIDNKLTFDSHINRMCKKVGQKLSALSIYLYKTKVYIYIKPNKN